MFDMLSSSTCNVHITDFNSVLTRNCFIPLTHVTVYSLFHQWLVVSSFEKWLSLADPKNMYALSNVRLVELQGFAKSVPRKITRLP